MIRGKEAIEAKVVEAMIKLLKQKDLSLITSDEISTEASVSKRTLYKYFDSKISMYLSVVEYSFMNMNEYINDYLVKKKVSSGVDIIREIGRAYLTYGLSHPFESKIITSFDETDYTEDYQQRIKDFNEYSNIFLPLKYIELALKETKFESAHSAETLSIMYHSSVLGLSTLIQSKHEWMEEFYKTDIQEIIENHLDLLISLIDPK